MLAWLIFEIYEHKLIALHCLLEWAAVLYEVGVYSLIDYLSYIFVGVNTLESTCILVVVDDIIRNFFLRVQVTQATESLLVIFKYFNRLVYTLIWGSGVVYLKVCYELSWLFCDAAIVIFFLLALPHVSFNNAFWLSLFRYHFNGVFVGSLMNRWLSKKDFSINWCLRLLSAYVSGLELGHPCWLEFLICDLLSLFLNETVNGSLVHWRVLRIVFWYAIQLMV